MIEFIGLFDYILQFTITHTHLHIHISVQSHVFTSRCSVVSSNGGSSPSSGFPNYPWPLGCQFLTATAHNDWISAVLWLTRELSYLLVDSYCVSYKNSEWTTEKTPLSSCSLRAVVYLFVSQLLPSNGSTGHNIKEYINQILTFYVQTSHWIKWISGYFLKRSIFWDITPYISVKSTDVFEKRITSTFRVEEYPS
jgi:hypothetical protein